MVPEIQLMPVCSWDMSRRHRSSLQLHECSVRVHSVGGEIPTAPLAWCLVLNRKSSQTAKQHSIFFSLHLAALLSVILAWSCGIQST